MNDKKVKGRIQEPEKRITNFLEVELGYTDKQARDEASRCLHCLKPRCVEGCPVNIMIPEFIKAIKEDNIKKAYEIITESSSLPAVCGRVCPQEKQCEAMCVKGLKGEAIAIGTVERYVADQAIINNFNSTKKKTKNDKKVAIVGSGPAGLTCAGDLAKKGYSVTIYEVLHKAGGVLTYGIPEFRLPKSIVEKEVESLRNLGVTILTDVPVGNSISIPELQQEYDAVFVGSGAGLPKFMGIPGEDANGVFSANEILTRINLMGAYKEDSKTPIKKGKKAYIIGGGNVAMDAVRCLKRLGIDAHLMYRRSEEELPARRVEVTHAKEEGVIFDLLQNPLEIITDENNNVTGMKVVNMILGEPDESGRRSVTEDPNSVHTIDCDMVVMALGTSPNHEALKGSDIALSDRGLIVVEGTKTSLDNVYAGGDAVTGAATVILAMEAGKKAAKEIMDALTK
jgi:glutamate synthase (NADPH/NADH) small chain